MKEESSNCFMTSLLLKEAACNEQLYIIMNTVFATTKKISLKSEFRITYHHPATPVTALRGRGTTKPTDVSVYIAYQYKGN